MTDANPPHVPDLTARHLSFGWWSLAVFLSLGILLELAHALKLGFYLDVSNETRRLMWTLAHAHGTLFGLVHVAFALSVPRLPGLVPSRAELTSKCLMAGTILMPTGFLLGGIFVYDGDPGLPVLLAPIGAALLLVAVVLIAYSSWNYSSRD